jgi:hypothetical protein
LKPKLKPTFGRGDFPSAGRLQVTDIIVFNCARTLKEEGILSLESNLVGLNPTILTLEPFGSRRNRKKLPVYEKARHPPDIPDGFNQRFIVSGFLLHIRVSSFTMYFVRKERSSSATVEWNG